MTTADKICEAVKELTASSPEKEITRKEIIDVILHKHPTTNEGTANCHISMATVNLWGKANYPNMKKRIISEASVKDLLYRVQLGTYVKYNPVKHGIWAIKMNFETKKLRPEQIKPPDGNT